MFQPLFYMSILYSTPCMYLIYSIDFILFQTYADVYCTECSILLCQFCHLHLHYSHKYKVLEKFRKEINSNMLLEKFKLEYDKYYIIKNKKIPIF